MRNHPKVLIVLILSGLGAALFEGGTMGILGLAVSVLVDEGNFLTGEIGGTLNRVFEVFNGSISKGGMFLLLVGIAVIAQIVKSVMLYISSASEIYLSIELDRGFQRHVTNTIMSMSYSEIVEHPSGSMTSYIDQAQCAKDVLSLVANASRAAVMFLTYGVIMVWISPTMALVSVVLIILVWLSVGQVSKKLFTLSKQAAKAKVVLLQWTVEYLNVPRLLRIFNSTLNAGSLINKARDDVLVPERHSLMIVAAIKPAMEVVAIVGAGGFLVFGYLLSGAGAAVEIPGLFVFVIIFFRLKPYIQALSDLRTKLARILPKLNLIEEFLAGSEGVSPYQGATSSSRLLRGIEFSNVRFQYPGSQGYALDNISFSIERGKITALVGPSGAGKSTIAELLLALRKPSSGHILIDGSKLDNINPAEWRERIGVVDQDVFLLNTTVKDNISFSRPNATMEMVVKACEAAHAVEFIEIMDEGYDTVIGERGYKLSGGQKQRLALARALLRNPDLLVLDEATSSLDSISERAVQKALEDMYENRTILIIAHRLSTVLNADRIVVLDTGRIVEQGTQAELLSKNGKFAQMWELQTKRDQDDHA
jgi:ATP-binding cassette subfamily B protein/subfamily B ATP-binding cassette protein MsbA